MHLDRGVHAPIGPTRRKINAIPCEALDAGVNIWGTGASPEGIDQNPAYYEFLLDSSWREEPVANITEHMIERAQLRYNLESPLPAVSAAWALLVASVYSDDINIGDGTGVAHIGAAQLWRGGAPSAMVCQIYGAWVQLIAASGTGSLDITEPFRYDLVNTGREVLAQLAGPAGKNFTAAIGATPMNTTDVERTGLFYIQVLEDIDRLVATDTAFQLGPWLAMAKRFAMPEDHEAAEDCADGVGSDSWPTITSCAAFYEWNARTQITTWKPTPLGRGDSWSIPAGPVDYACKHWSGLIRDYYAQRVRLVMNRALLDAAAGRELDTNATDILKAQLAYNWTTATNKYPIAPVGDAVLVSQAMQAKYSQFFSACDPSLSRKL